MKRAPVGFDRSRASDGEAKEKLKYQTLLKEYLELQKEYVSKKRKLQAAKQKRELSLAEVRFVKRKHKHLLKSQTHNADTDHLHLPNKDEEAEGGVGVYEEDVRSTKKIKKHDVQEDKGGEGKRKMSWPNQVTLNL